MLVYLLPLLLGVILLIAGRSIQNPSIQYSGIAALTVGMFYSVYLEANNQQQNTIPWKALTYTLGTGLAYILLIHDHIQNAHRVQQLRQQLSSQRDIFVGDIHDGVGSRLNNLLWLLRVRKPDIRHIIEELELCVEEVRFAINPSTSNPDHLHQQLGKLCASIQNTQPMLKVSFNAVGQAENIPANIAINLYRAIQEAFSNAVRHSNASLIEVRLIHQPQQILSFIIDDGQGIPNWSNQLQQQSPRKTDSLGLLGIMHRIQRIGGMANITSTSSGTIVKIKILWNGD